MVASEVSRFDAFRFSAAPCAIRLAPAQVWSFKGVLLGAEVFSVGVVEGHPAVIEVGHGTSE